MSKGPQHIRNYRIGQMLEMVETEIRELINIDMDLNRAETVSLNQLIQELLLVVERRRQRLQRTDQDV